MVAIDGNCKSGRVCRMGGGVSGRSVLVCCVCSSADGPRVMNEWMNE